MKKKNDSYIKYIIYLTLLTILFFLVAAILEGNLEYIIYGLIDIIVLILLLYNYKEFHFTYPVIIGLIFLLIINALGCTLYIGGTRLYDFWLIPNIFKFDNFAHFYGGFIVTFAVFNWLYPNFEKGFRNKTILFFIVLILVALGLGAANELLELLVVVLFNNNGVGDYINNALDFLFNALGAVTAVLWINIRNKK